MKIIDGDSLARMIEIRYAWHKDYTIEEVLEDIKQAPEINSTDKKFGEWIPIEKPRFGNPYRHYKCSNCGNPVPYRVSYCDSCGSRNA